MKKLIITLGALITTLLMFSGESVYAQGNALTNEKEIIDINPQVAENLDIAISTAYDLYTVGNYPELYTYTISDNVEYYKEILNGLNADRYYVSINGSEYGMIYINSSNKVGWYFGNIKKGLRSGNGNTLLLDKDVCRFFSGKYDMDIPAGDGQYTFILTSSNEIWSYSGYFKGILLNGEYNVYTSHPTLGENTVPLTFKDNHLISQSTSFVENEKTYLLEINMEEYIVNYGSNDNLDYSGSHKIKIPDGYELMSVITYPEKEKIYYIYDSLEEINTGYEIFR